MKIYKIGQHFMTCMKVNQNQSSPVEKFSYLISCLSGKKLCTIHGLPIITLNYKIAWHLLCDRYQNIRKLINYHIYPIIDMPSIKHIL